MSEFHTVIYISLCCFVPFQANKNKKRGNCLIHYLSKRYRQTPAEQINNSPRHFVYTIFTEVYTLDMSALLYHACSALKIGDFLRQV